MRRALVVAAASLFLVVPSRLFAAQEGGRPTATTIYVQPTDDGFQTYIVAAIVKKKVPANLVDREDLASLTLRAARVEVHEESTGSKVVKCLFAYCADIADKANTSVQLVDREGRIVWSYAVNKGRGAKNRQSMAEAIASHLKSDYFRR